MKSFYGIVFWLLVFIGISELHQLKLYAETIKFRPHMLDHLYEGCPENSQCEQSTGQLRKQWLQAVKAQNIEKLNQFRQQFGMPIKLWSRLILNETSTSTAKLQLPPLILWEANCKRLNQAHLSQAVLFASDFKSISAKTQQQAQLIFHQAYSFDHQGKLLNTYMIPRGESPLFFKANALYFTIEEEGHYIGLLVGPEGTLQLQTPESPSQLPTPFECPSDLVQQVRPKHPPDSDLYQDFRCMLLRDKKGLEKKYLLIGNTCP